MVKLLSRLPLRALYALSGFLAFLAYHVVRHRREVIREQLALVFPDLPEIERTAIHKRFASIGGVDLQIPPRRFSSSPSDGVEIPQLDRGLGTAIHELFAPLGGVNLPIPPRRKSHRPIPDFS